MNGDRPQTSSTFSTRGLDLLFRHIAQPQPKRDLVKDQVLGDHLVGVLHHQADELRPLLDRFCVIFSPLNRIAPLSSFSNPHISLDRVDLPAPFLPTMETISPSRTSKSMSLRLGVRHRRKNSRLSIFKIEGLLLLAVRRCDRAVPDAQRFVDALGVQAPDVPRFHFAGSP